MKVKTICTTRRAKIVIPVLWIAGIVLSLPGAFHQVSFAFGLDIFNEGKHGVICISSSAIMKK